MGGIISMLGVAPLATRGAGMASEGLLGLGIALLFFGAFRKKAE